MAIKPKHVRYTPRERRKLRGRKKCYGSDSVPRLSVFRSNRYTYAQLISDVSGKTLANVSTADEDVVKMIPDLVKEKELEGRSTSNKSAMCARAAGAKLGKIAVDLGVKEVVFDRNGFLFHGRVKELADGARSAGLKF